MATTVKGGFSYKKVGDKYLPINAKGETLGGPVDKPLPYEEFAAQGQPKTKAKPKTDPKA